MHYVVTLHGSVTVCDQDGAQPPNADELLESHFDGVMNELMTLGAGDPAIELEAATGMVRVAILVEDDDPDQAQLQASGTIRTAIHAAGGSTPDWPGPDHKVWAIRLVNLSTRPVELAAA